MSLDDFRGSYPNLRSVNKVFEKNTAAKPIQITNHTRYETNFCACYILNPMNVKYQQHNFIVFHWFSFIVRYLRIYVKKIADDYRNFARAVFRGLKQSASEFLSVVCSPQKVYQWLRCLAGHEEWVKNAAREAPAATLSFTDGMRAWAPSLVRVRNRRRRPTFCLLSSARSAGKQLSRKPSFPPCY